MRRPTLAEARLLSLVLFALGGCGHDEAPTVEVEPEQAVGASVAVGEDFSCVVRFGQVWCWGLDPEVQTIGSPPVDPEVAPHRLPELDGTVEIAADSHALCARKRDGSVWCRGLIAGPERPPDRAAQVPELSPARALGMHAGRACAVKDDETVRCWPERGEHPWTESLSVSAVSLHGGEGRICALDREGAVRCWRRSSGHREAPVAVGRPGVRSVAADPFCMLREGNVSCEPLVAETRTAAPGELSDVDTGDLGIAEVQTSPSGRICALVVGGNLYCWALPAADGVEPAPGPTEPGPDPIARDVVGYALGRNHVCANLRHHKVVCSGDNTWGEVGQPRHLDRRPVQVRGVRDATEVAAGDLFACALREGGSVMCWGTVRSSSGELLRSFAEAAEVPGLRPAASIAISHGTLFASGTDGRLQMWGARAPGPAPVTAEGITRVEELRASSRRACVRAGGQVRCLSAGAERWQRVASLDGVTGLFVGETAVCGRRGSSLVCDGARDVVPAGGAVPGERAFLGGEQVCAVDRRGVLRCAGHNGVGQLGLPPSRPLTSFTEVPDLTFVKGAALGPHVSCFWQAAGPLHCAGLEPDGLRPRGLGTGPFATAPGDRGDGSIVALDEVRNVRHASVGRTSCAATRRGEVWCWGANDAGQHGMGNPRHVDQMTEVDLPAASPVPPGPGLFF